ncbi:DUF3110 domain-containing protein [Acaryochloris marina NIES-2412]|uniref:DUF3110 domain-containing protein n=1 Tax=Acaryochloris marina TaxID=155978 RepID=UPI004058E495
MRVFVLLFNAGTENEGIHSLQKQVSTDEGSYTQDVVLAFEEEDDATRFALMLEAQDFPAATVEGFDQEEIETFCDSAGLELELIPMGSLAVPPETNVDRTDWQADQPDADQPDADVNDLDQIRRRLENLLD